MPSFENTRKLRVKVGDVIVAFSRPFRPEIFLVRIACRLALLAGCGVFAVARAAAGSPAAEIRVEILPADVPNRGTLFVDNETRGGSGHGNQALVECKNGDILSFYPQTSGEAMDGHSTTGWTEYRRSQDGGITWGEPVVLAYSKSVREGQEFHSALVEEAVTAPDGTLIVFVGRYTTFNWRRTTPVYLLSHDHGKTWAAPHPVDPGADITRIGRTHGVVVDGGLIFVLFDSGTHNSMRNGTGHKLYVSRDNGRTFELRSTLPFPETAWYGTLGLLQGGRLIAYAYRSGEEKDMQYAVSGDQGATWSGLQTARFAKALRNPQISGMLAGQYFMHGRSGQQGEDPRHLVLYRSSDGINWDEGVFLNKGPKDDADSYSTNELLGKFTGQPNRLLIQASIAYDGSHRVNLHHWTLQATSPPAR